MIIQYILHEYNFALIVYIRIMYMLIHVFIISGGVVSVEPGSNVMRGN